MQKKPELTYLSLHATQKMKFSIMNFFRKCDQIHRNLQIWSQLLKKPLMENFFFCAVSVAYLGPSFGSNIYDGMMVHLCENG